jgi:hypothetical protein
VGAGDGSVVGPERVNRKCPVGLDGHERRFLLAMLPALCAKGLWVKLPPWRRFAQGGGGKTDLRESGGDPVARTNNSQKKATQERFPVAVFTAWP